MCRAGTDSEITLGSLPSLIDASWDLQCFIHFSAKETTHTSLQYCSSFIRFDLNSLHLTFQVLFMFTADTQIIKAIWCRYLLIWPVSMSPGEKPRIFKGFGTDGYFTHEETGWMQKSTVTDHIVVENQSSFKKSTPQTEEKSKNKKHLVLLNIEVDI